MSTIDQRWDLNKLRDENEVLQELILTAELSAQTRLKIVKRATTLVKDIRVSRKPELMELFLAEYGLSTNEGIALMCLAEALFRVPDEVTIDALIEDKIAPSDWSKHLRQSNSPMVNASTWALLLTGRVLGDDQPILSKVIQKMIRRMGEPVIRTAVSTAMRHMAHQFVLGEDIETAMARAELLERKGYSYSYDMLGEAAITAEDAALYAQAYGNAIDAISSVSTTRDITSNPGVSIKLSALHPRYEVAQAERVIHELVPIVRAFAIKAAKAGIGLNIDAEEADRLGLSLEVISAVQRSPELAQWKGFGVVVQAYSRRAGDVIDGLYNLAKQFNRHFMIRLVKGAYWDSEIKAAQVKGLDDFPVFTHKAASDVSYIALSRKLLNMTDHVYPQFATHNAHSVSAILEMTSHLPKDKYEFQRLHGMGERLHEIVHHQEKTRCRIYAPVGKHRDLLAYLVRRLLENGANSSFVNRIVDEHIKPEEVAACPFSVVESNHQRSNAIQTGARLFLPDRQNAKGFDLTNTITLSSLDKTRPRRSDLKAHPVLYKKVQSQSVQNIVNPASGQKIGEVVLASEEDAEAALSSSQPWQVKVSERARILNKTADLYERGSGGICSILAAEAGKTLPDSVTELREATDFLRYYAHQAKFLNNPERGIFISISPWNFPLAIFTGQIAAALAAGNGVIAKPAETTNATATWAVKKLQQAGVPREVLQLVPGNGRTIGTKLVSDRRISGVAFTGSTETATKIQSAMAYKCRPGTPLIAETGGLNAMVIDSTALPEQAITDVVVSAFQSAGQRCSALRCLYLQEDIADNFIHQLKGAMNELCLGDPWNITTDIGPVITMEAKRNIESYITTAHLKGQLLHQLQTPEEGFFVAPALIEITDIGQLESEIFGPVLHVARFKPEELEQVLASINATGYALTFGIQTRIDQRIQIISERICAGNIYANRNQIGAIVGSQPFGGGGLSGTGPKAGGPHYLHRFTRTAAPKSHEKPDKKIDLQTLISRLKACLSEEKETETFHLPGPTGELNKFSLVPGLPVICAGPSLDAIKRQYDAITRLGGRAIAIEGDLPPEYLLHLPQFGGILWWGHVDKGRAYASALADRPGAIIPLITDYPDKTHAIREKHLCIDTTAAGGNASLLESSN